MPGRLQVPDAAPLLDRWEKRNSWRCRGCLSVRGTARFLCAGAAGGRHRCRCSVRGCRPSPLAAVVAVVVVAGSWWLVPRATYRLPRSFAGRFRRQRRGLVFFRRGQQDVAASPVLVWVKGKDVTFEKAASSHRFHVEVKAAKRPATTGGETPATRVPGFTAMRSEFLIRALAWRPRGPCPTRRPAVAVRSVRRVRARKNGCIFSSSARSIPLTVGSIDPRHHLG